jgi:hypothetical protein
MIDVKENQIWEKGSRLVKVEKLIPDTETGMVYRIVSESDDNREFIGEERTYVTNLFKHKYEYVGKE